MNANEAFALLRGKGKPSAFVGLAVEIASSADALARLLPWLIGREKLTRPLPPVPTLDEWLPLYRCHRAIPYALGPAFEIPGGFQALEVIDATHALVNCKPDELVEEIAILTDDEKRKLLLPFVGVPFPPADADLTRILEHHESGALIASDEDFDEALSTGPGQFFCRVWLPCWVLYRQYPTVLLRNARHGDLKSLENLIRLDKSIAHEPRVAEHIHQIQYNGTKRDRDLTSKALSSPPKDRITKQTMRYGLAGLISQAAMLFHCHVNQTEIRKLFDAIERVRSGKLADPHIPAGEAFTRAIHRNRTWPSAPSHLPGQ